MHFEMAPEQYRLLCENARTCGLSKRAYLIKLIEGGTPKARPSDELKTLRTEVHHIGNNINQIARNANAAGSASREDVRSALALLDKVYGLMAEIARR